MIIYVILDTYDDDYESCTHDSIVRGSVIGAFIDKEKADKCLLWSVLGGGYEQPCYDYDMEELFEVWPEETNDPNISRDDMKKMFDNIIKEKEYQGVYMMREVKLEDLNLKSLESITKLQKENKELKEYITHLETMPGGVEYQKAKDRFVNNKEY